MVRLLTFICFAFIFSCTIIEDSDITSQEELDNLKFVSIEIKQQTGSGTSAAMASVTSEDEIDTLVSAGKLSRATWMDWPALSGKLLLKSGVTTAFKSYASFLESGKPWTFYLFSADSIILELYSFRYDASGRLSNIITSAPYVQNGPATSNDTLIYKTNGELATITRKYPATGTTTTFADIMYITTYNSYKLNHYVFQGMEYERPCEGNGCGSQWGGNYHVSPTTTGFPAGVMNLVTFQREYLSMEDRNHSLEQWGCGDCIRYIDTFYFHPLMILKDQFEIGDDLLFIYMIDWWQPATAQQSTDNEKVTISFNYDL